LTHIMTSQYIRMSQTDVVGLRICVSSSYAGLRKISKWGTFFLIISRRVADMYLVSLKTTHFDNGFRQSYVDIANEANGGLEMVRSSFIVVSDDQALVQKTQQFGQMHGVSVQVMTPEQWETMLAAQTANTSATSVPSLVSGHGSAEGAKVLPFPGPQTNGETRRGVATINQLESVAIENAISAFKGNLTEAAKALGIGRATLYRKVKAYSIDPSMARKKKAA
jgi:hypothetical protein